MRTTDIAQNGVDQRKDRNSNCLGQEESYFTNGWMEWPSLVYASLLVTDNAFFWKEAFPECS